MKVHYLQHVPFEGPGSIDRWADSRRFPLTSTKLYNGETLPYNDRVVGIQFHLETTIENAENLIMHCKDEMVDGPYIQTPEQIMSKGERFAKINEIMNQMLDFLTFPNNPPA
jgi:hypothetical protein